MFLLCTFLSNHQNTIRKRYPFKLEKYKISSVEQLINNPELIQSLITRYKTNEVPRLKKLFDYYNGKSDILNRPSADPLKPNNKIMNPWSNFICNTTQAYFIGVPVSYQSDDENLMTALQDVYDSNGEQSHNAQLNKHVSVAGLGYELVYVNELGDIKFNSLSPLETFMVYDNSISTNPLAGVRFYESYDYVDESTQLFVEIYTSDFIYSYSQVEDELKLTEETQHYFNGVPVIQYSNNEEQFGDAELVKSLIDAYDIAMSDSVNSLEAFADSYMLISGLDMTPEQAKEMKQNRIILAGEKGDAKWLTKSSEPAEIENLKKRLVSDIHKFSYTPDISDDSFGSASSGESLKYKMLNLENITVIKERFFKQSLEERIKLITNFLNVKGHAYVYTDVTMKFTRNMPSNTASIVETMSKLIGVISKQTLLTELPFIEDVAYELELIEAEKAGTLEEYTAFNPTATEE